MNLYQPVGMALKPSGQAHEIDLEEIEAALDSVKPITPKLDLGPVLGLEVTDKLRGEFSYQPGLSQK